MTVVRAFENTASEKGLIHTASPMVLLIGGVLLLVIGVIMVALAKTAGNKSGARDLAETGGWVLGIIGLVGIYGGVFGWVWPPWS